MPIELSKELASADVAHLDLALFEEAVDYALKDCAAFEIENIKIEPATKGGDNFLGLIYRVKVHVRRSLGVDKVLNWIVKCVPDTSAHEFLHDGKVFLKEVICYREILPRMEAMCTEREQFGAKLYYARKQPLNTLIFEDLSIHDFRVASRETGLDEPHCLVLLRKLGKFHAMSMLMKMKDPNMMLGFHTGLLSKLILKDDGTPYRFYGAEIVILETIVRTWPGYEKIADKLKKYAENFRERLLHSVRSEPDDVCVLNHGDLWTNNILYKYQSTGQPKDVLFVDFQMSVWGSLGIDINYFFYTSVQLHLLQIRRSHLLHVYYEALSATLARYNYQQTPTFEQVALQVRRREDYGFFAAYAILPVVTLDQSNATDNNLNNWDDAEFMKNKIIQSYSVPRVQGVLKYCLKRFDELGIFD